MAFLNDNNNNGPYRNAGALTNDEIKHRILDVFAKFVSDVEPDRLSDYLMQENVISPDHWQRIRSENPAKQDRCRTLLIHLFSIHHPKAFLVVRQVLVEGKHHLLEILDTEVPSFGIREQPNNHTVLPDKTEPMKFQKNAGEKVQTTKLRAAELEIRNLKAKIQGLETDLKLVPRSAKPQPQSKEKILEQQEHRQEDKNKIQQLQQKNHDDQKSAREAEKTEKDPLQKPLQPLPLDAKKLDAKKLEPKQIETKKLEPKKLETKKLEHKQLEPKQLAARFQPGELRYELDPVLVQTIRTEAEKKLICGLTILDKELFVVSAQSSEVEVYNSMEFSHSRRWKLKELILPLDIGSCNRNKCLYLLDYKGQDQSKEILRVDPNGKLINKWSTGGAFGYGLSITDATNVILTVCFENKLNEYSPNGQLIREIKLSSDSGILYPWHAIKLTNGHFLVSHGFNDDDQHRVCEMDAYGKLKKSFGGKCGSNVGQMFNPFHLAVDGNEFVIVADRENSRVLLLDLDLKFKREILCEEKHSLRDPHRIHLDQTNGRLFVADNETDSRTMYRNGQILIFDCRPSTLQTNFDYKF